MTTTSVRWPARVLIGLLLTVALAGCATRWYKPGATEAEFEETLSACQVSAEKAVPPDIRYTINPGSRYVTRRCDDYGCSDYATYTPPTQTAYDANAGVRAQYVRACMFRHGWTTRAPGN
jgi:uncharacterized protein YceK